jgi:hypothetical protein
VLAHGEVAEIERRLRRGAVLRVTVAGDADAVAAAEQALAADPSVSSATTLPDGRIEIGVPGNEVDMAGLLARLVRDGHPIAGFAPAVSDLEELFLQVTELREVDAAEPGAGGIAA